MEARSHRLEISRPKPIPTVECSTPSSLPFPRPSPPPLPPPPPPPPFPKIAAVSATSNDGYAVDSMPWPTNLARPLSDIREMSEPSLAENVLPRTHLPPRNGWKTSGPITTTRDESLKDVLLANTATAQYQKPTVMVVHDGSSSYSSTPEHSSFYSVPRASVPRRSSSQKHSLRQLSGSARNMSTRSTRRPALVSPPNPTPSIPNRGGSHSPVKEAGLRLDPITSESARRVPSKTYVRSPYPTDILEFPSYKHPRIKVELQVSAPLFVGGGSVEGFVRVTVDDNERVVRRRRSLSIGAIAVDLLGFEEVEVGRRSIFLALGTELIDAMHPPPREMVQPATPLFTDHEFWSLGPSCTALPFMISLPLDTGPPPFVSKRASIRFRLSVTALMRDSGKQYRVRTSQNVQVLPTYDPEKALTSLSSPLVASDELSLPHSTGQESVRITAGLHRQVWVSGTSIFVDVHISNRCRKAIRRLEHTLERNILFYKHAAAMTREKCVGQTRIFENNEQTVLTRTSCKAGSGGWNGVDAHTSHTRTCELELPRGHATVRCGKYFEVRYFLNVTASLSNSKLVSVQLPVILIHMNSLDVLPNSVAQVAAAIEEERARCQPSRSLSRRRNAAHCRQRSFSSPARAEGLIRQPSYVQGRAFAAPRQQSLDQQREHRADIENLCTILNASPRKHRPQVPQGNGIRQVDGISGRADSRRAARDGVRPGALGLVSQHTSHADRRTHDAMSTGETLRDRVGRLRNLDFVRGRKSSEPEKARGPPHGSKRRSTDCSNEQSSTSPSALGLPIAMRNVSQDNPMERASTALSLRERPSRGRFEFKTVRRKASSSLRGRNRDVCERTRESRADAFGREQERMGWI